MDTLRTDGKKAPESVPGGDGFVAISDDRVESRARKRLFFRATKIGAYSSAGHRQCGAVLHLRLVAAGTMAPRPGLRCANLRLRPQLSLWVSRIQALTLTCLAVSLPYTQTFYCSWSKQGASGRAKQVSLLNLPLSRTGYPVFNAHSGSADAAAGFFPVDVYTTLGVSPRHDYITKSDSTVPPESSSLLHLVLLLPFTRESFGQINLFVETTHHAVKLSRPSWPHQ